MVTQTKRFSWQTSYLIRALVAVVWLSCTHATALETDQFTVPEAPLADLGAQLSSQVSEAIQSAIDVANRNPSANECTIASRVYRALGRGWVETLIERRLREARLDRSHTQFALPTAQSVYTSVAQRRRLAFHYMSPTVRLFGVYLGTDKLGHFFQQGYVSYLIFLDARSGGMTKSQATRAAVARAVAHERGIFGLGLTGVYSNADLAADYAGMKFYLNLTRPVKLGPTTRPPMLVRQDNRWQFNPQAGKDLLRHFVTDHFNEALNWSAYAPSIRKDVHDQIAARWPACARFYRIDREAMANYPADRLRLWHGEDYGHSSPQSEINAVANRSGRHRRSQRVVASRPAGWSGRIRDIRFARH